MRTFVCLIAFAMVLGSVPMLFQYDEAELLARTQVDASGEALTFSVTMDHMESMVTTGTNYPRYSWGEKRNYLFGADNVGQYVGKDPNLYAISLATKWNAARTIDPNHQTQFAAHKPVYADVANTTWGLYGEGFQSLMAFDNWYMSIASGRYFLNNSAANISWNQQSYVVPATTSYAGGASTAITFSVTHYCLTSDSLKTSVVSADNPRIKIWYNLTNQVAFMTVHPITNLQRGEVDGVGMSIQSSAMALAYIYFNGSETAYTNSFINNVGFFLSNIDSTDDILTFARDRWDELNQYTTLTIDDGATLDFWSGITAKVDAETNDSLTFHVDNDAYATLFINNMSTSGVVRITGDDSSVRYAVQDFNSFWMADSMQTYELYLVVQGLWDDGVEYTVEIVPDMAVACEYDMDGDGLNDVIRFENEYLQGYYNTHISSDRKESLYWEPNNYEFDSKLYTIDKLTGWRPDRYGQFYLDQYAENWPSMVGAPVETYRLNSRKIDLQVTGASGAILWYGNLTQISYDNSPVSWAWVTFSDWRYVAHFQSFTNAHDHALTMFSHYTQDLPGHFLKSGACARLGNVYLSDGQSTSASGSTTIRWHLPPSGTNTTLDAYWIAASFANVLDDGYIAGILPSRYPLEMRSTGDANFRYTHIHGFNRTVGVGERVAEALITGYFDSLANVTALYENWSGIQDFRIANGILYFISGIDLVDPETSWSFHTDREEHAYIESFGSVPLFLANQSLDSDGDLLVDGLLVNGVGSFLETNLTVLSDSDISLNVTTWNINSTLLVLWTNATSGTDWSITDLSPDLDYIVYQDDEFVAHYQGSSMSFSLTGGGTILILAAEPLSILSTPDNEASLNDLYEYLVIWSPADNESVVLSVASSLDGLELDDSTVVAIPTEVGIYWVNVTLTGYGNETVWQNYTLYVFTPETPEYMFIWMGLATVITLGLALLIIGLHSKDPIYLLLSGLIWLLGGMFVYTSINAAWTLIMIGLGVIVLFQGGMKFATKV